MKICDFLINKKYEGLSNEKYQSLQKSRAFYCFFVKKDYKLAVSLIKKVNVPTEEIILLFTNLYPKYAIDQMIERFKIDVDNIPYLKDQIDIQNPNLQSMIHGRRKRTFSYVGGHINRLRVLKSNKNEECTCSSAGNKWKDKINALQVFLLYFLDKKKELSQKIKELKHPKRISTSTLLKNADNKLLVMRKTSSEVRVRTMSGISTSLRNINSTRMVISEASEEDDNSIKDGKRESKCDLNILEDRDDLLTIQEISHQDERTVSMLMLLNMM